MSRFFTPVEPPGHVDAPGTSLSNKCVRWKMGTMEPERTGFEFHFCSLLAGVAFSESLHLSEPFSLPMK